jgi:hypothetical protein
MHPSSQTFRVSLDLWGYGNSSKVLTGHTVGQYRDVRNGQQLEDDEQKRDDVPFSRSPPLRFAHRAAAAFRNN